MRNLLARVGAWPAGTKVAGLVVALVVVAGGAGAVIAPRLAHGRTIRSTAHPSPPVATSTPSVGTSPTSSPVPLASTLSCTLPISRGNPGSGGFLAFPQGTFTPDPQSAITSEDGFSGLTYDRAVSKWLPVRRSAVAPDGSRYAYWDYRSAMVAVTAATGAETTLGPRPNGAASAARLNTSWSVVEATDAGVYAVPGGSYQGAPPGLWLFPWSGAGERQVTGSDFWQEVGGGAAWGTASQSVPEGAATTILRLDLAGGTPTDWFARPGLQSTVVGFDASGDPVVQAMSKDVTEVWLVTGRNNGTKLLTVPPSETQGTNGPNGPNRPNVQSVVGDDKGTWLATSDGLYLSTPSRTEKVSAVTGQLGGGCA
ncbi:MAG TPA: hypothetical protein VKF59_15250 [Candidatus Dormibacteraeota bacterium]|nr:hypothetical protein [Candidatus Dormibacteraeota bacterium]